MTTTLELPRQFIIDLPMAKKIARRAFPEYKGRKIRLTGLTKTVDTSYNSNWAGGTRTVYRFVRLDNGSVMANPNQQLAPWRHNAEAEQAQLQDGLVCVTHEIFQDHDLGLTVFTDQVIS